MFRLDDNQLLSLKNYIRIDYDDDDELLQELAGAAAADMGRMGIREDSNDPMWIMVLKAIVLDWYENRGNVGTIPKIADGAIFRLKMHNPNNYGTGGE